MLTVHDVEYLCTGAGILGCGGGGSPYLGGMLVKKEISEGKEIKIVNPFRCVHIYMITCQTHGYVCGSSISRGIPPICCY